MDDGFNDSKLYCMPGESESSIALGLAAICVGVYMIVIAAIIIACA